jgi:hypothetical protein
MPCGGFEESLDFGILLNFIITSYGILKSSVCKIQLKNDWFAKTRSRFLWDYKSQDRGSRLQILNSGDYDLRFTGF